MKIICAFDSFKGSMSAAEACCAAAQGWLASRPGDTVVCLPVSDGGEGMVECIATALGVPTEETVVHGPLMSPVTATYAVSADGATAYMEMAAASGLTLVPDAQRNPTVTTTYGVGEMVLDAVQRGCRHIVMGIGGSATCDGGRGMVEALCGHLPLPAEILVASDVNNPLFGPNGAAYVFAPQKGATPEQVRLLDQRLRDFAYATEQRGIASPALAQCPGAGAAGGLGYGLMAYLGAQLQSGIDLVLDAIGFDEALRDADLVLTGEGKSDRQTLMGKVPMGVLRRAQRQDVPVAVLSGAIEDASRLAEAGFSVLRSINADDLRPLSTLLQPAVAQQNMQETARLLAAAYQQ